MPDEKEPDSTDVIIITKYCDRCGKEFRVSDPHIRKVSQVGVIEKIICEDCIPLESLKK